LGHPQQVVVDPDVLDKDSACGLGATRPFPDLQAERGLFIERSVPLRTILAISMARGTRLLMPQ
jgi:hypothetical protein